MEIFFNTGTGASSWAIFIKLAVVVFLTVLFLLSVSKLMKKRKSEARVSIKGVVFWFIIWVTSVYLFFVAYGPGEVGKLQSESAPEGSMEMIDTLEGKSVEEVKKSREERRPEELRRQDNPGFEKEKNEADLYIEKVLKEYE